MDQGNFLRDAKANRQEQVGELSLEVLAKMLDENVCYLDTHYVQDRSLEIIEKTVSKLVFKSEDILKARKAFLHVLLEGAQKQVFGFQDDYKLAKKNLKKKKLKKEAGEVIDKIDRLRNRLPADATEERDMRCEPVCQLIASEILSNELLFKDEEFIDGCVEMDNKMLIETLYKFNFEGLFDELVASLDNSYKRANEKHWGCRRDQIRMKQIDNRLME